MERRPSSPTSIKLGRDREYDYLQNPVSKAIDIYKKLNLGASAFYFLHKLSQNSDLLKNEVINFAFNEIRRAIFTEDSYIINTTIKIEFTSILHAVYNDEFSRLCMDASKDTPMGNFLKFLLKNLSTEFLKAKLENSLASKFPKSNIRKELKKKYNKKTINFKQLSELVSHNLHTLPKSIKKADEEDIKEEKINLEGILTGLTKALTLEAIPRVATYTNELPTKIKHYPTLLKKLKIPKITPKTKYTNKLPREIKYYLTLLRKLKIRAASNSKLLEDIKLLLNTLKNNIQRDNEPGKIYATYKLTPKQAKLLFEQLKNLGLITPLTGDIKTPIKQLIQALDYSIMSLEEKITHSHSSLTGMRFK